MYAVTVTLTIASGQMPDFVPLMLVNARASLKDEPGCKRFDVCTDPEHPDTVFLYELYDSRADFDAHLATAHFKSFDSATAAMVTDKRLVTFAQVTS